MSGADRELAAFIAGFEISAEGFNAEYGGPDDEWLRLWFLKWRDGAPVPEACRARENPASPSYGESPPCSRPLGHEDGHSWERRCPSCNACDNPSTAADHEPYWWAMCVRWGQCPNDPDAFCTFPPDQLRNEIARAKADPAAYA